MFDLGKPEFETGTQCSVMLLSDLVEHVEKACSERLNFDVLFSSLFLFYQNRRLEMFLCPTEIPSRCSLAQCSSANNYTVHREIMSASACTKIKQYRFGECSVIVRLLKLYRPRTLWTNWLFYEVLWLQFAGSWIKCAVLSLFIRYGSTWTEKHRRQHCGAEREVSADLHCKWKWYSCFKVQFQKIYLHWLQYRGSFNHAFVQRWLKQTFRPCTHPPTSHPLLSFPFLFENGACMCWLNVFKLPEVLIIQTVSKDFIDRKKRDENDVQRVWIRYFGVLHHQQGRYEEKLSLVQ